MNYNEILEYSDMARLIEKNLKFKLYHDSYTSAVQAAIQYGKDSGYELSDDEIARKIGLGPAKPTPGKTNRITLTLFKNGKEQRKTLSFQVYRMNPDKFELNIYIS